ncbi:hypothetical protein MF406_02305 [Georgenia sp. TF02-10]|uniref:hypothetical protein n=1 Tax=Georgenia sp. TF02-10 TaxID=2917725 RepID=UPI001FA7C079|nr:hypothetical protein [Georgenia sp. TF02-10]UNX55142.1 hypothetical protein MF406_02305 [Georgenia sp. TF02-10]
MSRRRQRTQRWVVIVLAAVVTLALVLPLIAPLVAAAAPGPTASAGAAETAGPAATTDSGALASAGAPTDSPGAPVAGAPTDRARTPAAGAPTDPGTPADPGTAAGATASPSAPLVVIGTGGVRWEDLSALATPNLWALAEHGASGNMVVRSVRSSTCPADGWLALSAGRRAADLPTGTYGTCRALREAGSDGAVPGWSDYLDAAAEASYDAQPGLLGDRLADAGMPAVAVGAGAAIALAGSDGVVTGEHTFAPVSPTRLGEQVGAALPGHALAVVDVGTVRDRNRPLVLVPESASVDRTDEPDPSETAPPSSGEAWLLASPERAEQVAGVDARVGAVLEAVQAASPQATVVLGSLADSGTRSLMQVAVAAGPALGPDLPADGALLDTRSTRQPGMLQSTDLTPTVLGMLGLDVPAGLAGAPLGHAADGRTGPERVAYLADVNAHAVAVRPLTGPFYSALVAMNLLLYGVASVGLNRRWLDRTAARLEARGRGLPGRVARALRSGRPGGMLRVLRAVAVGVGAVPVASYLANLLPWWRADAPGLVLFAATAVLAAAVAAAALLGPWRGLLGPVAVVAGLTAAVLAVDVLTGATLQVSALMGVQPQVGGRFYGFNNSSFALFAAAALLVAMCLAEPLVRRGRRRAAAAAVGAVGVTAVVLDGLPAIGADFGGPPALVPGFLVLGLLTLGVRLTLRRVAGVLAAAAVVVVGFSLVDWLRPPAERSHLGRFVETVLDGGLWSVVGRKLGQNLANLFGSPLTFLAIGGIVLVVVLLSRPLRDAARGQDGGAYGWLVGDGAVGRIDRAAMLLTPLLVALGVTLGIGFVLNDSGIVIPAIGISVAVPLLISVVTGWLLGRQDPAAPGPPEGRADSPGRSDALRAGPQAQAR